MRKLLFILLLLFGNSLFSKTIITVTHPIEKYFIAKIANDKVYVRVVYDKSREFKLSDRSLVNSLSASSYYFKLNLKEEESILKRFKERNEDLEIIDITKNIKKLKSKDGKEIPYVWVDPLLVRDIAKNVYEELVKIRYYDRDIFKKNYENFLAEIDTIYLHLKKRLDNSEVNGFFVFNEHLDYFAKRYRLNIHHKEYRFFKISEISEMIRFSRKENIRHIIIDKDSSYEIAQSLNSQIQGKIIEFDIYSMHWKSNLYQLVRKISNF